MYNGIKYELLFTIKNINTSTHPMDEAGSRIIETTQCVTFLNDVYKEKIFHSYTTISFHSHFPIDFEKFLYIL